MRWTLALLLLGSSLIGHTADDVVIHAGEQAVIEFRFDAPPVADNGEPINFLVLAIGGSYVNFIGDSRLTQTLHDGAVPLGTREIGRGGGLSALFVTEDHPWEGVTLDFTSIQDGTINGRLVVRPDFDSVSTQTRIRFAGRLISGRLTDDEPLSPGPDAEIIACHIEAPIFRDRFSAEPLLSPPNASHRDCGLGS